MVVLVFKRVHIYATHLRSGLRAKYKLYSAMARDDRYLYDCGY